MLSDITLGQYFPSNSPMHKCDPRFKIIMLIAFIVSVFFAHTFLSYLYLVIFVAFLAVFSKIKLKTVLKGIKPVIFISALTGIINLFWTKGVGDPLISLGAITVYSEGIWRAIYMIVRIITLVAGTSVILTYTTTPMDLTDALESLLSPLKKIKMPVHEFSMMMSLSLRFVPTLLEETEKIMNAQKSRGADFETGGILKRAKALVPVLIPLFVSSFRSANDLATAMECRCYTGGENRTKLNSFIVKASDFVIIIVFAVLLSGIFFMNLVPFPIGFVI